MGSEDQTYAILRVSDNVTVCKAWQRVSLDSWSDVKTLSSLNMADGTIISADEYICAMKRATTSLTTIDLTEFFSYDGSVEEDICRIISKITLLFLLLYRGCNTTALRAFLFIVEIIDINHKNMTCYNSALSYVLRY